jgi:hypothetical protein
VVDFVPTKSLLLEIQLEVAIGPHRGDYAVALLVQRALDVRIEYWRGHRDKTSSEGDLRRGEGRSEQ